MNKKYAEDEIILRHTRRLFAETTWTQNRFINDRLLSEMARAGFIDPEPTDVDAFEKWSGNNRRNIINVFTGKTNFPLRWKWVWVNCLPDSHKIPCKKELQALTGSLYVPMPAYTSYRMPSASLLPDLIREFSEVMRDSSPAQDGYLSPEDSLESVQLYADQIADLLEASMRELINIQQGTGIMPARQVMAIMMSDFESGAPGPE